MKKSAILIAVILVMAMVFASCAPQTAELSAFDAGNNEGQRSEGDVAPEGEQSEETEQPVVTEQPSENPETAPEQSQPDAAEVTQTPVAGGVITINNSSAYPARANITWIYPDGTKGGWDQNGATLAIGNEYTINIPEAQVRST